MKEVGAFSLLISEFVLTHFKDYRVWDIEISFPQYSEEPTRGYYTHGLLEVSASNANGMWDSHSFKFNSPDKLKKDLFELFDEGVFQSLLKMIAL